jgi:hypothetical protein
MLRTEQESETHVISSTTTSQSPGHNPDGTIIEEKPFIQTSRPQPDADVTFVQAIYSGESWTFNVTVSHPDTGWEDYADGWNVVTPDGTVLKRNPNDPFTRELLHPHQNEQPFTRSQSGLILNEGITQVIVRAHDLVDGFGGAEILVDLEQGSGDSYEVIR